MRIDNAGNVTSPMLASLYGLLVGTGLLIIVFSTAALLQGGNLGDLLARHSESLSEVFLQRSILFIYALACSTIAVSILRREKNKRQEVGRSEIDQMEREFVALKSEIKQLKQAIVGRGEIDQLKGEIIGRVTSGLGFLMGELSRESDKLESLDPARLEQAISLCRQGYELLKDISPPARAMALNNLVFYLSIQGNEEERQFVMRNSRLLKDLGEKHDSPILLLTFCRAVLSYEDDPTLREEAYQVAARVASMPIESHLVEEAGVYMKALALGSDTIHLVDRGRTLG